MQRKIVLLSKEVVLPEYFEVYGGTYWRTPNINELSKKGTLFQRHYTAAPSTAMAFTAMFTGLYPYQTERKDYVQVADMNQNIFNIMEKKGYETHVLWSTNYSDIRHRYTRCYSENTVFHEDTKFNQHVGVHLPFSESTVKHDETKAQWSYEHIRKTIMGLKDIDKLFLWIHLPHVLLGRTCYGGDIDLVDRIVGDLRHCFGDESIYITADHGHMNLSKGKTCYGFDVNEKAIRIPLITPRICGLSVVDFPTSNTQLMDIILNSTLERQEFVISDCAYYEQPFRRLAVIRGNYKLIYNKAKRRKELYDIMWDPAEENDLLRHLLVDRDRQRRVVTEQVYFYPFRGEALSEYPILDHKFNEIWRQGTLFREKKNYAVRKLKNLKAMIRRLRLIR